MFIYVPQSTFLGRLNITYRHVSTSPEIPGYPSEVIPIFENVDKAKINTIRPSFLDYRGVWGLLKRSVQIYSRPEEGRELHFIPPEGFLAFPDVGVDVEPACDRTDIPHAITAYVENCDCIVTYDGHFNQISHKIKVFEPDAVPI